MAAWAVSASGRPLAGEGRGLDSDVRAALEEDAGGGNQGEDQ